MTTTPGFILAGIGTALPPHSIKQTAAAEVAQALRHLAPRQARLEGLLYRQSGVDSRHFAVLEDAAAAASPAPFFAPRTDTGDTGASIPANPTTAARMDRYATSAPKLAHEACAKALHAAHTAPGDITHLITVSCTGFQAPGTDIALFQSLGLSSEVQRTNIGFMGCHGAINGLRVAQAIAQADPSACILLCAVELCSLHFQYGTEASTVVANALFADGAAAVVGWRSNSARKSGAHSATSTPIHPVIQATGSFRIPNSQNAMTWRIGDHGFVMTLGPAVPSLIAEHLRPWLERWLTASGRRLTDIASWAVHPGGPRILAATQAALDLPPHALGISTQVLAELGNMSSPTVLFVLERILANNAIEMQPARTKHPALPCLLLAFGPGLVVEAALLDAATAGA